MKRKQRHYKNNGETLIKMDVCRKMSQCIEQSGVTTCEYEDNNNKNAEKNNDCWSISLTFGPFSFWQLFLSLVELNRSKINERKKGKHYDRRRRRSNEIVLPANGGSHTIDVFTGRNRKCALPFMVIPRSSHARILHRMSNAVLYRAYDLDETWDTIEPTHSAHTGAAFYSRGQCVSLIFPMRD